MDETEVKISSIRMSQTGFSLASYLQQALTRLPTGNKYRCNDDITIVCEHMYTSLTETRSG